MLELFMGLQIFIIYWNIHIFTNIFILRYKCWATCWMPFTGKEKVTQIMIYIWIQAVFLSGPLYKCSKMAQRIDAPCSSIFWTQYVLLKHTSSKSKSSGCIGHKLNDDFISIFPFRSCALCQLPCQNLDNSLVKTAWFVKKKNSHYSQNMYFDYTGVSEHHGLQSL